MKPTIDRIRGFEVLDSRGYPTVKVEVLLENGVRASGYAPSGASTGKRERLERRDNDKNRYLGRGVLEVTSLISSQVNQHFHGRDIFDQASIDDELQHFYEKDAKPGLGSNATSAVSMAIARAAALSCGLPLYRYLGGVGARRLPVPMMNIINGGKHADNTLRFQEFMIMPIGAPDFSEALRFGVETFHALKSILQQRHLTTNVGDEGGFAPDLKSNEDACDLIVAAIEGAGLVPGRDVSMALDPAATSFWKDGKYFLHGDLEQAASSDALLAEYARLVSLYPIISIEDGFAEDDWTPFAIQTQAMGSRIQIVGDDLYVTDVDLIRRGVEKGATNAVLIKINQIGTVTHTIEAIDLCRQSGLAFIVSHRSGETEDTFIADFTVAMGGGQIKTGSLSRSERLAKYNRLLEIEAELGDAALFYFNPPNKLNPKPHVNTKQRPNHTRNLGARLRRRSSKS